jgi:ATP-dependent Clp protease protease subunit
VADVAAVADSATSKAPRFIAEHSGQPLEKVSADMERDYFLTAEEAKQYGIIDTVLAHRFE